jgi:hypothetical protein
MKTYKISTKKQNIVSSLAIKASEIMHSIYGENFNLKNYQTFLTNLYKTARFAGKNWKYECEEMILNLTR